MEIYHSKSFVALVAASLLLTTVGFGYIQNYPATGYATAQVQDEVVSSGVGNFGSKLVQVRFYPVQTTDFI